MTGITLRTRGAFLTSLLAAPFSPVFGPELEVDLATSLESSSPAFCLNIVQQGGEYPLKTGFIEVDDVGFDFSSMEENPVIGYVNIEIFGTLLAGRLFAGHVTGDSAVKCHDMVYNLCQHIRYTFGG